MEEAGGSNPPEPTDFPSISTSDFLAGSFPVISSTSTVPRISAAKFDEMALHERFDGVVFDAQSRQPRVHPGI
jgi:hypothetical protein